MDSSDEELLNNVGTQWEKKLLENNQYDQFFGTATDTDVNDIPDSNQLKVLSEKFGHNKFRPLQWKIIKSILIDKKDNCAIMTTGYGKSLCYQYPAVYSGGITIVISPLISLMEDQVLSLSVKNISSCLLGSAQTSKATTYQEILENKYSLIYLTPEFAVVQDGLDLLKNIYSKLRITLIAIDEAHCVSSWGHDFRPSYRRLGLLKDIFPDVPFLAVTATATEQVKKDIIKILGLKNPQILCSGFDRPNLYFAVRIKSGSVLADLKSLMIRRDGRWVFDGPTIIYCIRRQDTEDISSLLESDGIDSLPYHAGMTLKNRKEAHENFVKDKVPVIVATIAFGMGIDKPDIRNVIHYGASKSMEGYYQEVGRAGRDGLPSKCVTFYKSQDFNTHRFLIQQGANKNQNLHLLDIINDYMTTTQCRRQFILSHFTSDPNLNLPKKRDCCDNCSQKTGIPDNQLYEGLDEQGNYDFTEDAITFLSAVAAMNETFGIAMYILFLKGSKSNKLYERHKTHPCYGSGKDKSDDWWKAIANFLDAKKYLIKISKSKGTFSYFVTGLSKTGNKFLNEPQGQKLIEKPSSEIIKLLRKKVQTSSGWISADGSLNRTSHATQNVGEATKTKNDVPSTSATGESAIQETQEIIDDRLKLFRLLRDCRAELAASNNCKPYMIASDYVLMEIAKHRPVDIRQLENMKINGLTVATINKFGDDFLKVVKDNTSGVKKLTIRDILQEYPIENAKISPTAEVTLSLIKNGLAPKEIANVRKLTYSTILNHIVSLMEMGHPIKMELLDITPDVRTTIIKVINNLGGKYSLLTPIKNACPPEITYEQIKVVCTHLKIRAHLKQLGLSYEEFEDFEAINDTSKSSILEILKKNPIDGLNSSAETTYTEFKNSHIINLLKNGYPIKMEQLGVSPKARTSIIQVINNLGGNHDNFEKILNACPIGITSNQIEIICAYLDVREHLSKIGIPYKEFEDFSYNEKIAKCNKLSDGGTEDDFDKNDDLLMALCDAMENQLQNETDNNVLNEINDTSDINNKPSTSSSVGFMDFEPVCKKAKVEDNSVLDSPPKASIDVLDSPPREVSKDDEIEVICLEPETIKTAVPKNTEIVNGKKGTSTETLLKSKKKLPQWLSKKSNRK